MRSALTRTLSACGVGMLIHGKLSAAGEYRLLRQCYEFAASGEGVSSCASLPESIEANLYWMMFGFLLLLLSADAPGLLLKLKKWNWKEECVDVRFPRLSAGGRRRLAFFLLTLAWLGMLIMGTIGFFSVPEHNYPDAVKSFPFPYLTDFEFRVVAPALFFGLNLLSAFAPRRIPTILAILSCALQSMLLLFIVFLNSGGV